MSRTKIGNLAILTTVLWILYTIGCSAITETFEIIQAIVIYGFPQRNSNWMLIPCIYLAVTVFICLQVLWLSWSARPALHRFFTPMALDGPVLWGCAIARVVLSIRLIYSVVAIVTTIGRSIDPIYSRDPHTVGWELLFYVLLLPVLELLGIVLAPALVRFVVRQVDSSVMWYTVWWTKMRFHEEEW